MLYGFCNTEGGETFMDSFPFSELFSFLLSALGMFFAFLSGIRRYKKRKKHKKKSRAPGKVNGSKK
jgi:hypothetical protein